MSKNSKDYIKYASYYWGEEFALMLDIEYRPEYDKIAAMGAHTIMIKIADELHDGKFKEEIFELLNYKMGK